VPSELIEAPKAELDQVANALDADLANDLETLDIQDRATRTGMLQAVPPSPCMGASCVRRRSICGRFGPNRTRLL
jgi:hypothetical protein